jgi:hypothetical protein
MNLELFDMAMEHITRIVRIIEVSTRSAVYLTVCGFT